MENDLLNNVLDNISLPVCLLDNNNEICYKNKSFSSLNIETLSDIELNYKNSYTLNEFTFANKNYKIVEIENLAHHDFISTVSHELRTPLTSIRGFADTMLASADKLSEEQQNKFLTIIRNQSDRLTRLVENLLEISSISKKSSLINKKIDFKNFIIPIITIFERKYKTRNYKTLISDNLPEIWADSDLLEQILTNLIDNASKYSFDNSTVTVKASFVNDYIEIKIIDEAVKIPQDKLTKIFNKFSRIDNPLTRTVQGSGLGLYITKKLTEKLNGKIYCENYEKGNIFTLLLPAANVESFLSTKLRSN